MSLDRSHITSMSLPPDTKLEPHSIYRYRPLTATEIKDYCSTLGLEIKDYSDDSRNLSRIFRGRSKISHSDKSQLQDDSHQKEIDKAKTELLERTPSYHKKRLKDKIEEYKKYRDEAKNKQATIIDEIRIIDNDISEKIKQVSEFTKEHEDELIKVNSVIRTKKRRFLNLIRKNPKKNTIEKS
jgi:hypothetical protein